MTTQLQRDPFARTTLMRSIASHRGRGGHTCDWCGQAGRTLYRYWWESDSGTARGIDYGREFCSVGCHRSYTS